jgi:IPT/TIG domain
MFPHIGPSEGKGIVRIYGKNFRDDFALQEVGCKIGESVGKARVISSTEMRCVVEEMELVDEG